MYLQNKYTIWYNNIISNAKSRTSINCYVEKHHIVPKSIGGNNDITNIVKLTAKEHYICHLLLPKMLAGKERKSMIFALWHLRNRHNYKGLSKFNSKIYEKLKTEFSKLSSELHTGKIISDEHKRILSETNKNRIFSDESRLKISKSKLGKKRKSFSQSHLENLNKFGSGTNNPNYGGLSEKHKANISTAAKNRPRLICHCGKECSPSNYKRWHGDNCRLPC